MLSRTSRVLTYLVTLLYALTGAALFFFPGQLAPVFAWKVTPFMGMTIGSWCLGNAWLAWLAARRWQWRLVYSSLVYLWLFGLFEMTVLIVFRAKLKLEQPIAWLYFASLAANVLAAVVGIIDWLRLRPRRETFGPPRGPGIRNATIVFVILVGFLGLFGLLIPNGGFGTHGGIFPEVMSDFTLRAFGAFYLALAVAALALLPESNIAPSLHHGFASFALAVAPVAAALVYLRLFDFVQRPGGLGYFGAYLIVAIPLLFVFRRHGTGAQPAMDS